MANINISIMEKRKLNILFIATEYQIKSKSIANSYGGQASYLKNVSTLIKKKNCNVSIYVVSNKAFNLNIKKIKVKGFGFNIKIPYFKKLADFLNCILISLHLNLVIFLENKKKKIDVVQYPSFLNFGVFLFLPKNCKKFCRISGITQLWRKCNRQDKNIINYISDFIEKKRVQSADKVYAPSKIISKKASTIYSKKIYTINSPFIKINLKNLKKIKKRSEEKIILFVGTLNRVKGFDLLVNAFSRVLKEHKNVLLIICGRNETIGKKINSIDYLLKRCSKYKSRIKFLGILPKRKYSIYIALQKL